MPLPTETKQLRKIKISGKIDPMHDLFNKNLKITDETGNPVLIKELKLILKTGEVPVAELTELVEVEFV